MDASRPLSTNIHNSSSTTSLHLLDPSSYSYNQNSNDRINHDTISVTTAFHVFYSGWSNSEKFNSPVKHRCPLASEERICLLGDSFASTLDPSGGAASASKENGEENISEWNDAGKSGAINDNGTLPTRVVSSVNQSERYVDDDWKDCTISVTAPSDDDLGNKNDAKSVSTTRQCIPSSSPPCSSISFKASKLDGDDEDESNKDKKKAANNESEEFKGRYSHQFFAAFAANFGAACLGTVMSWTSPALPDLRERKSVGEITTNEETWISTLSLLGAASACPIVGYGIERFGRKKCLLLLTAPFLGGWVLITLAQNIWMIYVGRFLSGFCGGGGSIAIPVYVTEAASANIRGMLASGFDMMITVGILYIFVIGTFVSWEWQAVSCALLLPVFYMLMCFVPESPTYLVEQGKHSDASNALRWLRGASSSQQVEIELQELISSVNESKKKAAAWKDLLESSALKPTILAVSLMVFQQLAAIDAVMFYTVDIFASSGADINENLSANIVGAIQVLATITAALTVDRGGRRLLLLISEIFMVISLGTLGLFFYLKEQNGGEPPEGLGMMPLASLMVYVVAFSVGMGPLPWLLMGELLPLHIKGKSSGLVTITRWLLGFAVTFLFQYLIKTVHPHGCYWFFSACCLVGAIFIYVFIPETNGKTLDEIQIFFKSKNETEPKSKQEQICGPVV